LVTVEEEKLHFWEEEVIAAKAGVDIEAIALIVEMATVKEALTVVEAKTAKDLKEAASEEDWMARDPKEAATAEVRMVKGLKEPTTVEAKTVRDLKEAITVEVKTGKDQTEVDTEEEIVVADTVVTMVVCFAAEAVTEVANEESVGPHGRIMNPLTSDIAT
jgi:hypothetical protein